MFSDLFGKSASNIMSYLIHTDPDQVCDEEILRWMDPRIKDSNKEILDSIHGYEFIGIQRNKLDIIQKHLSDINSCNCMIETALEHYRRKYAGLLRHFVTIVGGGEESALYIIGEIRANMSV